MKSIKELYRIGTGPSSSHTMGPRKAAEMFLERHPDAASFKVTLYGSLAATGKGHMTDVAIIDTLQPAAPVEIIWQPKVFLPFHPNGMTFAAFDANNKVTENWTVYSIGGGALAENNNTQTIESPEVYGMNNMTEILQWCERTGKSYWEYVKECENEDIWDYLAEVWSTMKDAIHRGLEAEGVLPGPLNLRRKASTYYIRATGYKQSLQSRGLVFSYALAVSEENASGTDLRFVRCDACRALSFTEKPRFQRYAYLAGIGHCRLNRKHRQVQRFYLRCGSRLSRRSRRCLRHGFSCRQPAIRW